MDWAKTTARGYKEQFKRRVLGFGAIYTTGFTVIEIRRSRERFIAMVGTPKLVDNFVLNHMTSVKRYHLVFHLVFLVVSIDEDWPSSLQWRHNGRDSVSNHQPHDCLLNRLFRCRSKKTSKLRVTGFVRGIHRGPVNSQHKWPVTRKMFPFDDVIMVRITNVSTDIRNHTMKRRRHFQIHFHEWKCLNLD